MLAKFGAWRGSASGSFHIDFAGMKTDPRFWPSFKPTRPGPVRISLPRFGVGYLEVLATTASIFAAQGRYAVMELGAGWGPVGVRAVLLARRMGLQTHATFVEPMSGNQQRLARHMAVNGLSEPVHRRVAAAIGCVDGLGWMKSKPADWLSAREIEAREVEVALALPAGAAPAWPGNEVSLRGGQNATCVPVMTLQTLLGTAPTVNFMHMRFAGSPAKIVAGAKALQEKVHFLLIPNLPDPELDQTSEALQELGLRPIMAIKRGCELVEGVFSLKMEHAFGFWANPALTSAATFDRIKADFAQLLK